MQPPLFAGTCQEAPLLALRPEDYLATDSPEAMSSALLLSTALQIPLSVCRTLLEAHGSQLRKVAAVGRAELDSAGLTAKQTARFLAFVEAAKRFGQEEFEPGVPFRGSYDVYAHFREQLRELLVERFYAVLLDNKNRKIRDLLISQGSLTASIVHPRDVYRPVILEAAAAVIFVHNHPAGDPTPSKEDIEITRRLREVGDLVGIRVLDHIIVGKGRYVSFVDDGYW